jgi:hypothetical protein
MKLGQKMSDESKRKISLATKGENNPMYGRKGKDHPKYGKIVSIEGRKKISDANKNESNSMWKGGITKTNIPLYDTYAAQLELYEEIRSSEESYLEVRCTYCGRWFIPKRMDVISRMNSINGYRQGESRLYCSKVVKNNVLYMGNHQNK